MSFKKHPLRDQAVPIPSALCSRKAYIDALIADGFRPILDGPSGLYLSKGEYEEEDAWAIWVSWDIDGRFCVETVTDERPGR